MTCMQVKEVQMYIGRGEEEHTRAFPTRRSDHSVQIPEISGVPDHVQEKHDDLCQYFRAEPSIAGGIFIWTRGFVGSIISARQGRR